MRTLVAVVMSVLALTSASACGGGDGDGESGAEPEEWAAAVCGGVQAWQNEIVRRADELEEEATKVSSIAEARDLLVDFYDAVIKRTDEMVGALEAAGHPAVENGEAIARDIREGLEEFKPVLEEARKKTAELPDDPQAFAQGAQAIGSQVETAGDQIGSRLETTGEKYDAPELRSAFDETPACQALDRR